SAPTPALVSATSISSASSAPVCVTTVFGPLEIVLRSDVIVRAPARPDRSSVSVPSFAAPTTLSLSYWTSTRYVSSPAPPSRNSVPTKDGSTDFSVIVSLPRSPLIVRRVTDDTFRTVFDPPQQHVTKNRFELFNI